MKRLTWWARGLVVVAVSLTQSQAATIRPQITFWRYNYAGAEQAVLNESARRVTAFFADIGVDTSWVDCPLVANAQVGGCHVNMSSTEIAIRILRQKMWRRLTIDGQPLGFALLYARLDRVNFIDVLYDRAEQLAEEGPPSIEQILAAVIVHETGHLLLGAGAHSAWGIMRARWLPHDLALLAAGHLTMTKEEAARMCAELRLRDKLFQSADSSVIARMPGRFH
jgi:hypothetical protein